MSQKKSNPEVNNAVDAFSPVAEQIGRDVADYSVKIADTIEVMLDKGFPRALVIINVGIGVLCGLRDELKKHK